MSALVTFTRHSLAFAVIYAPKVAARRFTRSLASALRYLLRLFEKLLGQHRLSKVIELLTALFPPFVVALYRSPWPTYWNLRQEAVVEMFRYMYTKERDVVRKYVRFLTGALKPKHASVTYVRDEVKMLANPFEGYWVRSKGSPAQEKRSGGWGKETVLLYIHGGAFYTGSALMQLGMFERMFEQFKRKVSSSDFAIFSLEYGLAPEHPFPQALYQAVEAYAWLVRQGYSNIIIGGDSAGGNLATAATLVIRDSYPELPLPKCMLLLSPWVNLSNEHPAEVDRQTVFGMDIVSPCKVSQLKEWYLGADFRAAGSNPLVSPVLADLTGLPPMFVNAGGAENLLADIVDFVDKAYDCGVPVTFDLDDHMVHVYPTLVDALAHPAAESAIRRFVDYIIRECGIEEDAPAPAASAASRTPACGMPDWDCKAAVPCCEAAMHCSDSVLSVAALNGSPQKWVDSRANPMCCACGPVAGAPGQGKGGHGSTFGCEDGGVEGALQLLGRARDAQAAVRKLQPVDHMMDELMILQKCAMQLLY